jgi:hypothetical protein
MFRQKFIKLKSYADAQLSNYFPSVRGAVLLIVIPAVFIVPIYFFSILSEIVTFFLPDSLFHVRPGPRMKVSCFWRWSYSFISSDSWEKKNGPRP